VNENFAISYFTASNIQTMQFHQAILSLFFLVGASSTVEYASAFAPISRINTLSSSTWLNSQTGDIKSPAVNDNLNATANSIGGIAISHGEATQRLGVSTGPTVWSEFGRIAQEFEPVNLGQGFPDWLPPKFAVDSLVEAVLDSAKSPHQYTRPAGHPNLVKQLARRYSIHMKRDIEPMAEVAVTVGASQALYISLQTLVKPGEFLFLPTKIGSLTRGAWL
jgi:DNA-binding transcriptional MocR family regulator